MDRAALLGGTHTHLSPLISNHSAVLFVLHHVALAPSQVLSGFLGGQVSCSCQLYCCPPDTNDTVRDKHPSFSHSSWGTDTHDGGPGGAQHGELGAEFSFGFI